MEIFEGNKQLIKLITDVDSEFKDYFLKDGSKFESSSYFFTSIQIGSSDQFIYSLNDSDLDILPREIRLSIQRKWNVIISDQRVGK